MDNELVPSGFLEVATDKSVAQQVNTDGSESQAAVDARLGPALAAQPVVAQAAAAAAAPAVTAEIASRDLVSGADGRALPADLAGTWVSLPRSTGYLTAFIGVPSGRPIVGVTVGGKWRADIDDLGGGSASLLVPDSVQEWWVGPTQTWTGSFLATSGIGTTGEIVAIDWTPRTGAYAVKVGQAGVDDHNFGGRWCEPGRGSLLQYQNHGVTNSIEVVISPGAGTAQGFIGQPVRTIPIGSPMSYGQIWCRKHLRTATTDTFWILARNDANWGVVELVVDWSAGTVTYTGTYKRLFSFTQQPYMSSADGGLNASGHACVRIACGYNPGASRHEVYLVELDLETGIVTDVLNPSFTHNISSGSYVNDSSLTPVLSDTASGSSRRLYYPRPASAGATWGVLHSDHSIANPAAGIYSETTYNPATGVKSTRTFGPTGAKFGGSVDSNYIGGMGYSKSGVVYLCREAAGKWTLEREGTVLKTSSRPLIRPNIPDGGPLEVLYSHLHYYGATYFEYLGDLEGLEYAS